MKISAIAAALGVAMFIAAPAGGETPRADAAARAARSAECQKQADAKGLHDRDRRKFLADCKKGA